MCVDIVSRIFQFSGLDGVIPCAYVCKAWHDTMQHPSIWFTLFETESIPRIEGNDVATAKEDFQFMYPRTHSAKQMAPLGRFVGIVPQVDQVVFEKFRTIIDPYDPTKKMSETWVFVVEPESIYRDDVDEPLINALKAEGDFNTDAEIDELKKQGVRFPYSLKNLNVCGEHPVTNKHNTKVFGYFHPNVLKQCNTISKAVRVTLMRKEFPECTENKRWVQQKKELAKNEHVPVKLSTRVFYNVTNILNKGTCPDKKEGNRLNYSRTSDEFMFGNEKRPATIGGFDVTTGVYISHEQDHPFDGFGAAPEFPAGVQQPIGL